MPLRKTKLIESHLYFTNACIISCIYVFCGYVAFICVINDCYLRHQDNTDFSIALIVKNNYSLKFTLTDLSMTDCM